MGGRRGHHRRLRRQAPPAGQRDESTGRHDPYAVYSTYRVLMDVINGAGERQPRFRLSKKSVTVKIIKTFFWIISLFKRYLFLQVFLTI